MTSTAPSSTSRAPGCLSMLVGTLIIPLAVGYLLFTLALREGGTGGDEKYRGTADVSNCGADARMLGLLQQCDADNVVLGPNYPSGPTHVPHGHQVVITRDAVQGRIAVVERCQSFAGRVVTRTSCTLYPAGFPRSVWWSWLGYITVPLGVFVYFGFRAGADARRFRRRARAARTTQPAGPTAAADPPAQEEQR